MDAAELLARLGELAVTVVQLPDGTATLRKPRGFARDAELADLVPLLRMHRDAVLALCKRSAVEESESQECQECGHGVHTDDRAAVWSCCRFLMCPWWVADLGPAWVPDARNRERYRRERGG